MSACPTCGKPVDPLRAPAAKIKGGKVVAYCSKECAGAADTAPVARPAEPAPAPAAKVGKRTPVTGVPKSAKDLDSGPIIEIVHEPATGVVTSAGDVRREQIPPSRRSYTDGAIEIADTGHIDDYVDVEPPRRHTLRNLLVVLLLLAGGGAFAAYRLGYLDEYLPKSHEAPPAPPPQPSVRAEPPPEPAKAPPVTPAAALDEARTALANQLASATPRVQRLAASALARTGDKPALDALNAALATETSDLAKLEIAYALARGGDNHGVDVLVAALTSPRRDTKLEAGRRLALLGDKRGAPVLAEYLEVSQLRLGAAEALAYVADPKALDVLDKIRKDDHATADDRARATIALGVGGHADVADALKAMLTDARQNAFAAKALAQLHDPAGRQVLVDQLAIPSLRVPAARALRILDPALDPSPLLPPLLAELGSAKDTEQVQAAEAILLLAGPADWSAHE
ncbi:MAG: HEAT repeat domain-containing protein [Acidobacteriota bacterium]